MLQPQPWGRLRSLALALQQEPRPAMHSQLKLRARPAARSL